MWLDLPEPLKYRRVPRYILSHSVALTFFLSSKNGKNENFVEIREREREVESYGVLLLCKKAFSHGKNIGHYEFGNR